MENRISDNIKEVTDKNDLQLVREISFVASLIINLLFLVALISYSPHDSAWSVQSSNLQVENAVGMVGAWAADIALSLLGLTSYLLPLVLAILSWQIYGNHIISIEKIDVFVIKLIGLLLTIFSISAMVQLFFDVNFYLPQGIGGIIGNWLANVTIIYGSNIGATLLLWLMFFAGTSMFFSFSWLKIADGIGWFVLLPFRFMLKKLTQYLNYRKQAKQQRLARREQTIKQQEIINVWDETEVQSKITDVQSVIEQEVATQKPSFTLDEPDSKPKHQTTEQLPTISLLKPKQSSGHGYSEQTLKAMSRQVEMKLKDFKIDVEVVGVEPGPVVTRFEFMPAPGVKASRITNLATDLARSLSQVSVRVVEVIQGKAVIGLEVPNENREIVYLSEIIGSKQFEKSKSPLTFALGKDIAGNPVVANLANMPHVLVAGTTGSGKSVCINTMILSLLYKSLPDQVKLIMIDPKMLELSLYDGIPHLLTPVVTDMSEATTALGWSVAEMERRYKLMSLLGVRNLEGYNNKIKKETKAGNTLNDPTVPEGMEPKILEQLPYIVVVIDEFADLIMVVGKKVEELIVRLAQKARASGIHLVLATQRPSVDVITGLIKSNIPTRMAFQVSSKMDSRVVLDQMGAEQLLGKGDMLYLRPGQAFPDRVHGAFVQEDEIHKIVEYLKSNFETNYIDSLANEFDESSAGNDISKDTSGESDELYDQAVQVVLETGKASISGVQRKLRIGYNRSANLIEAMEAAGLVSAPGHNGQRQVIAPRPE